MTELVEYKTATGRTILVESVDGVGPQLSSKKPVVSPQTIESALSAMEPVLQAIEDAIASIKKPSSTTVEFAIGFKGGANIFIASGEANASIKITLGWKDS